MFVKQGIRWATRSTNGIRGIKPPCPSYRNGTSQNTPSHVPAGTTNAPASTCWIPAAAPSPACGRPRAGRHQTSDTSRQPAKASRFICPRLPVCRRLSLSGRFPSGATRWNEIRPHLFAAHAAAARCILWKKPWPNCWHTKTWTEFKVPNDAIGCGFHEASGGVLSHHVVIRDGKIANYHPYPPTPLERQLARHLRHARASRRCRRAEHADL